MFDDVIAPVVENASDPSATIFPNADGSVNAACHSLGFLHGGESLAPGAVNLVVGRSQVTTSIQIPEQGTDVMQAVNLKLGVIMAACVLLVSCSTLTAPFKEADPRWADFKSWTKATELAPGTGNPTGFLGGVHLGEEAYRDVYVNDVAKQALLGSGPYNLPAGSVIVKEQFASKADWEEGRRAAHTISLKVAQTDELSKDNWIWTDSYKGTAGQRAFCSGCHSDAAKSDFVFTTGDFLKTQ